MGTSLQDIPKKLQYIVLDSDYVSGSNNTFTLNLSLEANTHAEDISQVIGIKLVDFHLTHANHDHLGNFIDIICPEIPQRSQMLNERSGQIFARIPLEKNCDKQWKPFNKETNFFNPISIQKLDFKISESLDNGVYQTLQPTSKWYMILEITTIDVKEKPINREVQILQALYALIGKIDLLHQSVQRLPNKDEAEKILEETKRKKFSFNYIIIAFLALIAGYIYYVNKIRNAFIPNPI
jgi:hypothetical protein